MLYIKDFTMNHYVGFSQIGSHIIIMIVPVVSLIFRALVFIDLIILLLNMILYIVYVYQMMKRAMEKIPRIETRLHLPPNKPSSSEKLVLHIHLHL